MRPKDVTTNSNNYLYAYPTVTGGNEVTMISNTNIAAGPGVSDVLIGAVSLGVTGGNLNLANGKASVVSGGYFNAASNSNASVSGGEASLASGVGSSVSGGFNNFAEGFASSVLGGKENKASGEYEQDF